MVLLVSGLFIMSAMSRTEVILNTLCGLCPWLADGRVDGHTRYVSCAWYRDFVAAVHQFNTVSAMLSRVCCGTRGVAMEVARSLAYARWDNS